MSQYSTPATNRVFELLDMPRRIMLRRAYRSFRRNLDEYQSRMACYSLITGSRDWHW